MFFVFSIKVFEYLEGLVPYKLKTQHLNYVSFRHTLINCSIEKYEFKNDTK